jgi:ketosteroid isomerase-like protein
VTPAEKLALAQRSYAAISAGLDVDALIPLYHPECEWRMGYISAAAGADAYRGHDGLRGWMSVLDEGFESFATEIDLARVTRDGTLVVRFDIQARSRGTQMELSLKGWQLIKFRDGLILAVVQLDDQPPEWDKATPLSVLPHRPEAF